MIQFSTQDRANYGIKPTVSVILEKELKVQNSDKFDIQKESVQSEITKVHPKNKVSDSIVTSETKVPSAFESSVHIAGNNVTCSLPNLNSDNQNSENII